MAVDQTRETGPARQPRVSVVLPIYDGAPFLAQAIESILAQTFRDFELITIDDGSRDASGEILDRFARSDSRVTALYQANAGMIAALNRGLALARGEFIARMDQDDVAHPERFARQVSFLDAHSDVAVVGSAVTLIDETGKRIRDVDYPAIPETVAKFLEIGAPLAHPAVMMRRDAVGAVGGYREAFRYAEDYDLWLRMAERYRMSNLADRLLLYRQHQSKQSSTYAVEQRFATRMALAAAHCRRAGKPDPSDGLSALTLRDIDRFDLSPGERGTLPLELVETLLAADPTMRKPNAVRTALDLLEQADVASTDGARLVRAMMMLAYGFGRRGQPLAAARWLSRAVRCRRNGFADVCAVTFRWAVHRLARRGRPAARKGEGTRLHPMEKRRFVEWLASPGGPGAAPCLRKFRPRAMARFVLALRNTLSGRPSRPRDFRCLHLPSTPFVKVVALRHHAKAFRTRVFVETGTFFGDTTAAVADLFERCYTIELSPELYARAQKRFLGTSHVVCINGESGAELARVLEDIKEPALFWLDAHASGGVTADGGFDPILQELGAIFRHRIKDHVVLVDDARGREEMIMRAVPSNYRVSLRNDIIRIVPA